jgi:hypothetical protein
MANVMLKVPVCESSKESVPVTVMELTPAERGKLQEKLVEVSFANTSLHVTVIGSIPEIDPAMVPVIVAYGVLIVAPFDGPVMLRPVMVSGGPTVKVPELLDTPDTVTTIGPVVAPTGTGATMVMLLQLVGVADMPLNVTVLPACVAPKFVPYSVTESPTAPRSDDSPVTVHPATVNIAPLLPTPATVTTIFPVVALLGTFTTTA